MLDQEIRHGIKLPKECDNVFIKLDMVRAYDRVSLTYTSLVLRKMGFGEIFIDSLWRIISNNLYFILINGKSHSFFHSTRGLRKGYPLSTALIIFGVEVLSRQHNIFYHDHLYKLFEMESIGPQIDHLSFANNITYIHC